MASTEPELRPLDACAHQIATCVFCPKLCRFGCPVAEAESRETVTPWGLMVRLDDARRGAAPFDTATAEIWNHCTGCRRCQQICKYDNPVATVMYAARAATSRAGLADPALWAWAEAAPPESAAWSALPAEGPLRLLRGHADDETVRAALALLAAAGYPDPGRPEDDLFHSGVRYLEAGRADAWDRHAAALRRALEGARTLICLDAGDAAALRTGPPPPFRVLHLTEALSGRLARLEVVVEGDVLYLDACRLGRGLGVYDPPRDLLGRVISGTVREAVMRREMAGCCGAGAGFAATSPAAAADVAQDFVADVPDIPVVVADPMCAAHLTATVGGRAVYDWTRLLARAVAGGERR